MKFINESVYWHGTGIIPNFLNRLLHEVTGYVAAVILFFFKVTLFPLLEELPPKNYFVFYTRMEVFNKELGQVFI
jgi:hypothetical protein